MVIGIVLGSIAIVIIFIIIFGGIKIVPQTKVYVIERFGSFRKILKNGINFIIPFIDKIILKESLKERVMDFPAQDVITKDNVTMKIDTVVYMQITDPKLFSYGVERPLFAIENLTATTLRNLIGDLELDQTLTSRDSVNEKLRAILDDATDAWGVKVIRVELKNILPPVDIRKAMEKQMRAEREKRQQILTAEGEKAANILNAEGIREAKILKAEGQRQSEILRAEGIKKSIELINSSKPTQESLVIKSFEALAKAAQGESTTLIIPSDVADISKFSSIFGTVTGKTSKSTSKKINKKTNKLDDIIETIKTKKQDK